jgi:hypothetical protein
MHSPPLQGGEITLAGPHRSHQPIGDFVDLKDRHEKFSCGVGTSEIPFWAGLETIQASKKDLIARGDQERAEYVKQINQMNHTIQLLTLKARQMESILSQVMVNKSHSETRLLESKSTLCDSIRNANEQLSSNQCRHESDMSKHREGLDIVMRENSILERRFLEQKEEFNVKIHEYDTKEKEIHRHRSASPCGRPQESGGRTQGSGRRWGGRPRARRCGAY